MKTKIIIGGVAIALVAGTAMKLFSNKNEVYENIYRHDVAKKILVQADTARLENLERSFTYTGTFTSVKEVMIIPQVRGEVTRVYFNEGDVVRAGQPLVQIDDELLQAQFVSAESNYETAKRNLERYENASTGGGVSQLQLDNYRLNFKNAESQLKQIDKQIRLSKIQAPCSGTITFKDVESGSVVGSTPVARITDLSQLKLEFSVPEKEIGLFKEGELMTIATDVFPTESFTGKIHYVASRADNAHNYTVKLLIANNQTSAPLKAGMYGRATISKSVNQNSIAIPRTALLGSAKNPQVFVVDGSVVHLKAIETGARNGESVEVVAGLKRGEIVVTGGQINLTDGSQVQIVN